MLTKVFSLLLIFCFGLWVHEFIKYSPLFGKSSYWIVLFIISICLAFIVRHLLIKSKVNILNNQEIYMSSLLGLTFLLPSLFNVVNRLASSNSINTYSAQVISTNKVFRGPYTAKLTLCKDESRLFDIVYDSKIFSETVVIQSKKGVVTGEYLINLKTNIEDTKSVSCK